MSTTRILWMIASVCLASTGCAMAIETDPPDPRIDGAEDEHALATPAEVLAETRLEDFSSQMEPSGDEHPSLDASEMARFELRAEGVLTDAAAALKRKVDPAHSPADSRGTTEK